MYCVICELCLHLVEEFMCGRCLCGSGEFMCERCLHWGGEFVYFMVCQKLPDVISAIKCVNPIILLLFFVLVTVLIFLVYAIDLYIKILKITLLYTSCRKKS